AGERLRGERGGAERVVGDQTCRARRIGLEHRRAIAHRLRRVNEHPAELAAADDAERRARRDPAITRRRAVARAALPFCRRAHFSSALIARAASLWRWRYASRRVRNAASLAASIATANSAALAAPALPIANVATGTPRGIWTIE